MAIKYSDEENKIREKLIESIEEMAGKLSSIPWNVVSTKDLKKLESALRLEGY